MKKIFQFLTFLGLCSLATSCYYDEMPAEKVSPLPDAVSYLNDIQPIWDASCTACHKPGATAPDLTAANSYLALTKNDKYVVPGFADQSLLHKYLIGDGKPVMPTSGQLPASTINLVDKWINDGALDN